MPTPLVIDAALAFRTLVPNPHQERLLGLVDEWRRQGRELIAPTLWLYELTSAMAKAVHFGVVAEAEGRQALALVQRLDVQLVAPDAALTLAAYDWTLRLHRAAAYDSFYLALAETLTCELWTLDAHLRAAVGLPWVRTAEL